MSEDNSPFIERSRNERTDEQRVSVSTPLDEQALLTVSRNVTQVRAEPTPDSEQLTQAVIGEPLTLFGKENGWLEIETWDSVRGWVRESAAVEAAAWAALSHHPELDHHPEPVEGCAPHKVMITDLIVEARAEPGCDSELVTKLPIGAVLSETPHPDPLPQGERGNWVGLLLPDGITCWVSSSSVAAGGDCGVLTDPSPQPLSQSASLRLLSGSASPARGEGEFGASVVKMAKRFIGTPYLWGGTTPFGIDCSGLSQLVYRLHGVNLPRNSRQQAVCEQLVDIPPIAIQAGDLLFFGPASKTGLDTVNHVGIAIGPSEFIHSYGATGVITSRLDAEPFAAMLRVARKVRE